MVSRGSEYADGPCLGELVTILLAGTVHVATELLVSESVALASSAGMSIAFGLYIIGRARRTAGALRVWGMRRDNFGPALRAHLGFAALGTLALLGYGTAAGSLSLPSTFWLTLALYPAWGIVQQFALQNLIARNLTGALRSPLGLALAAALLFGASHWPRLDLVVLTVIAGVFFTLIYRKHPNLWAVGIAHGVLGSFAVYLVLQEDPGAALLRWLPVPEPRGGPG